MMLLFAVVFIRVTVVYKTDFGLYIYLQKMEKNKECAIQRIKEAKVMFRRSRVRFPMVSLDFFICIILPAALQPWGRFML
jgi:hypothetical protein